MNGVRRVPARAPSDVADQVLAAAAGVTGIAALYLFGSTALGMAGPLSDVDVAVLLAPGTDEQEVLGRLTDALARRLRSDRIDVISLHSAPLPVGYRVVREGLLLLDRDRAARTRFTAETIRHYLDFQPLRERALAFVGNASLGGR